MPRSRLLDEGDDRQGAHVRATKEIAARLRGEIIRAFRGLTAPGITEAKVRRVLELQQRLEPLMRRDLMNLGQTSYRGWSRAWTKATGLRRMRPEPGVVETQEIVDFPFQGQTWSYRLRTHMPSMVDLMRVFRPDPGRTREQAFADLERLAGRVAARVATLARTEANRVNQVMSDRAASDVLGVDGVAGWRYMTMDDERVRPEHRVLHGRAYGVDEARPAVPNGPNCILGTVPVGGSFLGALRALYSGPACEITTEAGRLLVTPEHRVATPHGWVPASRIRQGDHVLGEQVPQGAGVSNHVDDHEEPATAEQVFRLLQEVGEGLRVEARGVDLDGDERWVQGDVDVVALYGELLEWREAAHAQPLGQLKFVGRDAQGAFVAGAGPRDLRLDRVPLSAAGDLRRLRLSDHARGLPAELLPLLGLRVGPPADWDPPLHEHSAEARARYAEFVGELLQRGAGRVATHEVLNVERRTWTGHVFDLQSARGWFCAGGTIIENCRCFYVPIMRPGAIVRARRERGVR